MGTILQSTCTNCGYQAQLFVGGGMRDCRPETAIAAAPQDSAFADALRRGARFNIDRDVSVCQRCHKLFAVPYVTYWPEDGEARHTAVACPDCGWLLTRLGSKNESISCPVCGHRMGLTPCGHWD